MTAIRLIRRLRRDTRAVAMLEFALITPFFIAMALTTLEIGYYTLANNRMQRLASMTADLVAQSGTADVGASEGQIYDLFSAIDLTAKPFDVRNYGRVVITGIKGESTDKGKTVDRIIKWQRFDGAYVAAAPVVGCNQTTNKATLPAGQRLPLDEMLFHVQVSFKYQPLFTSLPMQMFDVPTDFTRTAMYRARSKNFTSPTPDPRFPEKKKCTSPTGL